MLIGLPVIAGTDLVKQNLIAQYLLKLKSIYSSSELIL